MLRSRRDRAGRGGVCRGERDTCGGCLRNPPRVRGGVGAHAGHATGVRWGAAGRPWQDVSALFRVESRFFRYSRYSDYSRFRDQGGVPLLLRGRGVGRARALWRHWGRGLWAWRRCGPRAAMNDAHAVVQCQWWSTRERAGIADVGAERDHSTILLCAGSVHSGPATWSERHTRHAAGPGAAHGTRLRATA